MKSRESILFRQPRLRIVAVLDNKLRVTSEKNSLALQPGQFCLLPASLKEIEFWTEIESSFLFIEPGQ